MKVLNGQKMNKEIKIYKNLKNNDKNFVFDNKSKIIVIENTKQNRKKHFTFNLIENAVFECLFITIGNKSVDIVVNLNGSNSIIKLSTISISSSDETNKINLIVNHNFEYTTSIINSLALASSNSVINLDETIKINKNIENTVTSLKERGILTNDTASVILKPILLIDNYNTKASHASSCGLLDEDSLYYIMSRGYSFSEAKTIIINSLLTNYILPYKNCGVEEIISKEIY